MKIRIASHPITLNGLKVPSGVCYVNDKDGKFVFNTIHNFPKFKLIEGFIFYPERWSRFKVDTYGVAQYLFKGTWIKLAYSFAVETVRKIITKMSALTGAVRTAAKSVRIDSARKIAEIHRDGDVPRERKVVAEYTPFNGTAYSLRKINSVSDDSPLFNQRVVNESVSLIAPPNHPSKDTCIPKKTDADKNKEKRQKKPAFNADADIEWRGYTEWIRDNVPEFVRRHANRNVHNWTFSVSEKKAMYDLYNEGITDAELIFGDCISNLGFNFAD